MHIGTAQVHAHYSQFSLEPESPPRDQVPFQDPRENAQGFSAFGTLAGVATPSDTGDCDVTVERLVEMPELEGAVQAVAFPLKLVDGTLFLRDVNGSDRGRFDVPSGDHDVLVRFFPREASAEDAEAGLRSWHIVITVLPAGTAAPRCFRLEHGDPPGELFTH